jgi:hypothetical protein
MPCVYTIVTHKYEQTLRCGGGEIRRPRRQVLFRSRFARHGKVFRISHGKRAGAFLSSLFVHCVHSLREWLDAFGTVDWKEVEQYLQFSGIFHLIPFL